jgi:multimeric flavodoxin WrbA
MKLLAINGSPRKKLSNTDRMLKPFMEGAKEAGADVDQIYLQGMNIKPCIGCFNCWLKTPGKCLQEDDMKGLLDLLREADVIVFATPLYVCGMTAQMKTMLDRFIPLALPFIEVRDGQCTHPFREGTRNSSMVLLSNCGFHEMHHFDELVAHVQAFARLGCRQYLGSILRPHGPMMEIFDALDPDKMKPVYEACREAGRFAGRNELIPPQVLNRVSRELLPLDDFIQMANAYFRQEIEKNTGAG